MPNTKSAIKRTKKTQAQSLVNKVRKSKYKLAIKKMQAYIDAKK
jgi:ribosomal protein S20